APHHELEISERSLESPKRFGADSRIDFDQPAVTGGNEARVASKENLRVRRALLERPDALPGIHRPDHDTLVDVICQHATAFVEVECGAGSDNLVTVDGARHRVCRGKSPDALTRQRVPDSHYSVQPALGQSLPVVAENEGHPEGAGQRALVIGGKAFHELAAPTVPDTDETFHVEESDQCSVIRRSRAD